MNLEICTTQLGADDALKDFLLRAIYFQEQQGLLIATDDSEQDFINLYGYDKGQLQEALTALKRAIKNSK